MKKNLKRKLKLLIQIKRMMTKLMIKKIIVLKEKINYLIGDFKIEGNIIKIKTK